MFNFILFYLFFLGCQLSTKSKKSKINNPIKKKRKEKKNQIIIVIGSPHNPRKPPSQVLSLCFNIFCASRTQRLGPKQTQSLRETEVEYKANRKKRRINKQVVTHILVASSWELGHLKYKQFHTNIQIIYTQRRREK